MEPGVKKKSNKSFHLIFKNSHHFDKEREFTQSCFVWFFLAFASITILFI